MAIKSLEEIKSWLKTPEHIRRILVDISDITTINGTSIGTVYFSNGGYTTASTDLPANISYIPKITGGVSFSESFSPTGDLSISYGDIELDNTDGSLDYLIDYIFTNKSISIYLGDPSWPKSEYKKLFIGTVVDVLARSRSTINIVIADKLQKLNTSLSETTIIQPTKGNQEDLLPVCYGECFNITPLTYQTTTGTTHLLQTISAGVSVPNVLTFSASHNLLIGDTLVWPTSFNGIEANILYYVVTIPSNNSLTIKKGYYSTAALSNLTNGSALNKQALANSGDTYYIVHKGPIENIIEVRDNGAGPIDYIADLNTGRFKLKRKAFGQITCSVQGDKPSSTYSNTIGSVITSILTNPVGNSLRLELADIDTAQLNSYTQPVGYYTNSNQNLLEVCNQIASSVRAKLYVTVGPQTDETTVGLIRLVKLDISNVAEHIITTSDIEQFSISIGTKTEVRAATKLGYCKNWTVQQSGLATGLPPIAANILSNEWQHVYVDDPAIKTRYNLTDEPKQEDTLLVTIAAATTEATARNNFWKTPKYVYTMVCYPHMFNIELGDCVSINNPRFNLTNKLGTVISVNRDWIGGRIEIGVLA